VAAYPESAEGVVEGRFGAPGDRDLLVILARESDDRFCLGDRRDRPLRAVLELAGPPAGRAALCACWSRPGAPCSLSPNRCVTAEAGGTAELTLPMAMVCGSADEGVLELDLRATGAPACAPWSVRWSIAE
jgi:hypothetical protein